MINDVKTLSLYDVTTGSGAVTGTAVDLLTYNMVNSPLPAHLILNAQATTGSPAGVVFVTESATSAGTYTAVKTFDTSGSETSGSLTFTTAGGNNLTEYQCVITKEFVKVVLPALTTAGSANIFVGLQQRQRYA